MIATIAIIDDDEAVRDSTRLLLESYDYSVCEHPSATDFLERATDQIDCMLVDQNMPGMTGLELLEHLRAKGLEFPALIITGRADPAMVPRAERLGVKLLHKPIDEKHLLQLIEKTRRIRRKPGT